jgi:hypothetical protein
MNATPKTRRGKIAALPYELRETLCWRMRDGWTGPRLIKWLETAAPEIGSVNDQNITNWRQGGYRDWMKQQDRLDSIRSRAEETRRQLEAGGFSILDKSIYDLAEKLTDADMDPGKAAAAVAALKNAVTASERAATDKARAGLAVEALALERKKFARQTATLFLEWYADQRARQIAEGPATSTDEKVDLLGQLMFGEDWK